MHRATQAHPSRFGHARTGHALNYWRHARRERSRAPAGSMIGARVRGAPRAIWIWLPCRRARAVVAGRGSGHGHSRFGSLARGVTAPCSLPCGNRFSRCIHRPPSIQIQDQDDDPPAGRLPFRWIHRGQGNNRARVTCGASPCPGVRLRFGLV